MFRRAGGTPLVLPIFSAARRVSVSRVRDAPAGESKTSPKSAHDDATTAVRNSKTARLKISGFSK